MTTPPIADVAKLYRDLGIITHPLSSPKDSDSNPGKRPLKPGWSKLTESMTDSEIREFLIDRDCNLGAVCGSASNLMVIDIDWHIKGIWDNILSGIDTSTFVQQNRTLGRWHVFFQFNDDFKLKHCKPLGFDLLGEGGNVVMAPSIHASGEKYVMAGDISKRPEMPPVIIERIEIVIETFNKLRQTLKNCRRDFRDFFNAQFINDKHPQYHDLTVFRGMEGRNRMLHLMAELKVNGATEDEMLLVCMLAFGDDYKEEQSRTEISHIKPMPATTKSIIFDPILSEFHREDSKPIISTRDPAHDVKTMSSEAIAALGFIYLKRRLQMNVEEDHFIKIYCRYMSTTTDAYSDYSYMGALWLLSAACQGKISLTLKQTVVYPNLYILLCGLSTISRKSTAVNKAKQILEVTQGKKLYNDEYSLEGYLELLRDNPISNFVKDEAVGLFRKYNKRYNDGIYELENAIYDCQPVRKTLAREKGNKKEIVVENEYVTHFYATTQHNYASCMSIDDFRCGYGYRFLYCHPQYKKERMPLTLEEESDRRAYTDVIDAYMELYETIGKQTQIWFKANKDALDYLDEFDDKMQKEIIKHRDEDIAAAWGRNVEHILKLCMLIEIGKNKPSFTITLETMTEACRLAREYFLPMCIEIIERLQEDEKLNKIEKVLGILRRKERTCKHSVLLKNSKMCSDDFNKVIDTLKESGVITEYVEDGSHAKWYVLREESALDKMAL